MDVRELTQDNLRKYKINSEYRNIFTKEITRNNQDIQASFDKFDFVLDHEKSYYPQEDLEQSKGAIIVGAKQQDGYIIVARFTIHSISGVISHMSITVYDQDKYCESIVYNVPTHAELGSKTVWLFNRGHYYSNDGLSVTEDQQGEFSVQERDIVTP